MRFLFVVQGEGRGHFTQALAMSELLRRQGDQVIAVLVGKNSHRELPDFFVKKIQAQVIPFVSPDFLPTPQNKRPDLFQSVVANIGKLPVFYRSMRFIHQQIQDFQPDVVINFYELLTGLTYLIMPPGIPYVCIGHQYMFLHRDFEFPGHLSWGKIASLRFFTRLTCIGAVRRLALSFYPAEEDKSEGITVVPPLLRREVLHCESKRGDYLLGYVLNSGYASEITKWSEKHEEMPLHFFWDKSGVPETLKVSPVLSFHRVDDQSFIRYMAACRAYATTAGFESVCEALYLGKPILMVPVHIEQECNAWDARRSGAGFVSGTFDLSRLVQFIPEYNPRPGFQEWVHCAEIKIYAELKAVYRPSSVYRLYNRLYHLMN